MRLNVRHFVQIVEAIFDLPQPIYEFGSLQVPGQETIADLRSLFPNKNYVGCDISSGKGVDRIENVESNKLPSESIGTVIFVETIEHVENPHRAISEIYRVLGSDGILVMTSAMDLPIHNYPHDYWRFTPEGFRALLSQFSKSIIGYQGYELQPHTIFGIGFKDSSKPLDYYFSEFVLGASTEVRTGNAPRSYKLKLVRLLMGLSIVRRHLYLFEVLRKYISTDNIYFEFIDNHTG